MVDALNFDPNDESDDREDSAGTDVGWTVRIMFRDDGSKKAAKQQLILPKTEGRNCKVRRAALWLLMKSTVVKYARVKYDIHHPEYPQGGLCWRLMMRSPTLGKVELKFSSAFEVH